MATARQTGHPRIVTLFQPHRYTRTQLCWNDFLTCFDETDELILLPIYAASEGPIEGVTTEALIEGIQKRVGDQLKISYAATPEAALETVMRVKKDGDLILTLGAGSITKLGDSLAKRLTQN